MIDLDLLRFRDRLKFKKAEGKRYLFDEVRRKWLLVQPEELVRQLFVNYLLVEKGYSAGRIGIERGIKVNQLEKRCDILVFDKKHAPFLLVECKAPTVNLDDEVFWQIAQYNRPLQVPFFVATNGEKTFCCRMDYQENQHFFLPEIPDLE